MNRKLNIITNLLRRSAVLLLGLAMLASTTLVFAHGGMEHVMGTVVKVANGVLTVKTAKGNVDVALTDKTELTSNNQPAQVADLKPGTRVVVDVMEQGKTKMAHSVKLGAPGNSEHSHEAHK
ncbi:MAG TPA: hypothetical protein VJ731_11410 [Terriglobales bacterium]|nr:hypothetical protein [Terriglobales bacterium]